MEVEHLYMNPGNKRTFLVFHTPYIKVMPQNMDFRVTYILICETITTVKEWQAISLHGSLIKEHFGQWLPTMSEKLFP